MKFDTQSFKKTKQIHGLKIAGLIAYVALWVAIYFLV